MDQSHLSNDREPGSSRPQLTLLAALAHPDDETFGMGGTLALYARRGVAVHLVCATRGEAGEVDEKYLEGFDSIAERRQHELRCAAQLIGLAGVHFLSYRDSGMAGSAENAHPQALKNAPPEKVASDIAHYLRLLKPQVVITFDPIGGYMHPDHIMISEATTRAFFDLRREADEAASANPGSPQALPYAPQRLYYHTLPRAMLRLAVRLMPFFGRDPSRFGKNGDIDLLSIARHSFPTHAVIDYREVSEIRDRASACHESQGGRQMGGGILGWLRRTIEARETFMQAYPEPRSGRVIRDLFEDFLSGDGARS